MDIHDSLSAKVLGQIALIQGMVAHLPHKESILSFVCNGLSDVPGVDKVTYRTRMSKAKQQKRSVKEPVPLFKIEIKTKDHFHGELMLSIANEAVFDPYIPFIENLGNMLVVILEERRQRSLNQSLMDDLEKRVYERTKELELEIQERQKIELALRASDQRFSNSFESSSIGITMTGLDGRFLLVNTALCKMFNYTRQELLSLTFSEVTHPDDTDKSMSFLQEMLRGERDSFEDEKRYLKKDGSVFWASIKVACVRDDAGHPQHFFSHISDVSLRRQAIEALRAEKEFTETALNAQQDTFFLFDPFMGKAIRWNRSFSDIAGYSDAEISRMRAPDQYYSPEDLARAAKAIENVLKTGQGRIELDLICKDGHTIPTEYNVAVLKDNADKPEFLIAIGRDISERKVAEAQRRSLEHRLRQSQKLEAIGTMVGGISHELNNILQSIFLYGDLVKEQLTEKDLQIAMQHILDDGKRAKDIVGQVLTFSRKTKIDMKPRTLHGIVHDVLSLERASLPPSIEIEHDIDMNCGAILCDKTQLHQIIINICNNAFHAMGEKGGTLTVSLHQVQAVMTEDSEETEVLELRISDTGRGMDVKTAERVFDPFFTTKEIGEGTGLGLSVVHGLVEMMGGKIYVSSQPDVGTTFCIQLSVVDMPITELSSTLQPQTTEIHLSMLLIDDEENILRSTENILTRMGFTIDTSSNGQDALDLFKLNPDKYDLIVSDYSMPKMSGLDLIQEIRRSGSKIPIILSTGQIGMEFEKNYGALGATSFIQKPWAVKELIQIIRKINFR